MGYEMRTTGRFSGLLLLVAGTAAGLFGQVNATPRQPNEGQISLTVTVSSKSGDSVAGLTQSDFAVLDNKAPQPITSFRALSGPETKTEVIVVLDDLNLPYDRVTYARQQIEQFLGSKEGNLSQPTTLAIMLDTGMQIQPEFTTNGNELRASLDHMTVGLRSITRSTGFYGAEERFQLSLNAFRQLIAREAARPGRKLIIWVAPGWPLLSGPQIQLTTKNEEAIFNDVVAFSTEMRRGHITLDAVNPLGAGGNLEAMDYYENFLKGVKDPRHTDVADLGLQVLAIQSGGQVFNASNDISGLLQRSYDQRQNLYELTFAAAPGEHDNEYHQIQVQVNKPGLLAHTNTGYYARPLYPAAQQSKPVDVTKTR
jgi:VWFA-related protein